MKRVLLSGVVFFSLILSCASGEEALPPDPPSPSATAPADAAGPAPEASTAPAVSKKVYRFKHVTVDLETGTVSCPATSIDAQYALEFLLCRRGTKEHESLLTTPAEAWQIHAGLLMLGLSPGKPGKYIGEGDFVQYIPPRGPQLDIRLRWTDESGKKHDDAAIDWLKLSGQADSDNKPETWVFVGSELLPGGGYWADADGGIIAVANLPSAVIDVPFESAQPIEERLFEVNRQALPPVGTQVELVIRPLEGSKNYPHARALLEIDRNGRMTINGEPIALNELQEWAFKWTQQHEHGMVVIRCSALAPGIYADMARLELKVGGVFEFDKQVAPLFVPLLPRTQAQAAIDLANWRDRFAESKEQLREPGRQAELMLQQLQRERQELKRLETLWDEYEQQLRTQLDAYRKEHPAAGEADAEQGESPQP